MSGHLYAVTEHVARLLATDGRAAELLDPALPTPGWARHVAVGPHWDVVGQALAARAASHEHVPFVGGVPVLPHRVPAAVRLATATATSASALAPPTWSVAARVALDGPPLVHRLPGAAVRRLAAVVGVPARASVLAWVDGAAAWTVGFAGTPVDDGLLDAAAALIDVLALVDEAARLCDALLWVLR